MAPAQSIPPSPLPSPPPPSTYLPFNPLYWSTIPPYHPTSPHPPSPQQPTTHSYMHPTDVIMLNRPLKGQSHEKKHIFLLYLKCKKKSIMKNLHIGKNHTLLEVKLPMSPCVRQLVLVCRSDLISYKGGKLSTIILSHLALICIF